MALRTLNFSDPLMKALKAVNSIGGKTLTEEDLKKQRSSMELAGKIASPASGITIDSFSLGSIACEWIHPDLAHNPNYVILYSHGGGYTCGGLSYSRILAAKLALATGFSVISYVYRLAPENPYPAQLEDARSIFDYLLQEGYDPEHILVAGDSAGGNLSLCLTQELLNEGSRAPRMLLLFSPWTDMTASSKSYTRYQEKDPILTYDFIISVRDAYIAGAGDPEDARFSPLFGDFTGFPPTYIQVGRNEILLDDSTRLAKAIQAAGASAEIKIFENGWHVFQQMPLPLANRAMKELADVVSRTIYNTH